MVRIGKTLKLGRDLKEKSMASIPSGNLWQFWINLVSLEASKYAGLEDIESHVNIM
jgi:hypothetical protein